MVVSLRIVLILIIIDCLSKRYNNHALYYVYLTVAVLI